MAIQKLSEEDVKNRYISPAIEKAGWDKEHYNMEYYFTDGEIQIRGNKIKRGKPKRADYLLSYKGDFPLAIVEAKDNNHAVADGIQQAIEYGTILDIPFVYSSNGMGFVEHDFLNGTEKEISLDEFPSPEELWIRYTSKKDINSEVEKIITLPAHFDLKSKKKPRYYQRIAIDRTVEAIAKGKNRVLLVMATGTGKTFTAFQIVHKLLKSRMKKRVLYLADRNILVDQTMQQDFAPFEDIMTKIENKELDSSYEIYFSLYQQLVDYDKEEQPYEQLDPKFFDLIIVDECHRGSAKEDSQWREILDYFGSATQIGMTATPKETKDVSNISYFGEPLYTYSLKDGIEDGFLAPYKVIRVVTDIDAEGYRPEKGKRDFYGQEIEDRLYNSLDFDKNIIIDERTKVVASRITEYLKKTDRFAKTIVFCTDEEHALRMREALINENSDLVEENSKYVMRITGSDDEGKKNLDYFISENEDYPVIATTSQLLSTGVDCKTCKLIVLDKNIQSMTEFKQIIGRGTRLKENKGKTHFTIMDFRNNTRNFADPEFNGEPMVDERFDPNKPIIIENPPENYDPKTDDEIKLKYRVKDVNVKVILEQNQCYDSEGKLITENLLDFTKTNIINEYGSLENFINRWSSTEKRDAIIDELYKHDIFLDELRETVGNEDMDDFDLICHVAFDKKPLTRQERANNVKKRDYLNKYEGVAREILEKLLDKYASSGITNLENREILENKEFRKYGGPIKIAKAFGSPKNYLDAVNGLKKELFV